LQPSPSDFRHFVARDPLFSSIYTTSQFIANPDSAFLSSPLSPSPGLGFASEPKDGLCGAAIIADISVFGNLFLIYFDE